MPGIPLELETSWLDVPALATEFGRRLRAAELPAAPERAARFALALTLTEPISRRRLYWVARSVFVSDRSEVPGFDRVFAAVFGGAPLTDVRSEVPTATEVTEELDRTPPEATAGLEPAAERTPGTAAALAPREHGRSPEHPEAAPVPVMASAEEVLRAKRFDALAPHERLALARLMRTLDLSAPLRRTRRYEHRRHGRAVDLRRTLRASLRSGGDPARLARRRRRLRPRRIVLLCDISGSMEPYARAYVQFLACAARVGPHAEAFVFATRLTRLTRALSARSTDRALARAAAAAPDWSSGTRIGEALRTFNDRHGRRGMARGAVVVILSDGWERGDPALLAREMARLHRLAHRVVWVNPRVAGRGFSPRTGGMAAALPHCDALLSGHTLDSLAAVAAAIGGAAIPAPATVWPQPDLAEDEPWASATPVPGSSVAMPSGYGPARGRTTPGWRIGAEP